MKKRIMLPLVYILVVILFLSFVYGQVVCSENEDCLGGICTTLLKDIRNIMTDDTSYPGKLTKIYAVASVLKDYFLVMESGVGEDCIPLDGELYDEEGRLTDYARSLAPPMLELNLDELPKLHPENYGNNYFEPGTYTVRVGDGFGKGDILIKIVSFTVQEEPGDEKGRAIVEVFKRESDGYYYHIPTSKDNTRKITRRSYFDLFGITLELMAYPWEVDPIENTIIYHEDCSIYFDYCYDETSDFYAPSVAGCNSRCPFEATIGEVKVQNRIYFAVFPENYESLALFSIELLEQCYNADMDFLRYDQQKPRIGLKIILESEGSAMVGKDECTYGTRTEMLLDDNVNILDFLIGEKENKRCPNYLNLGHELIHTMTKEILSENSGLNEGLADFVGFQNGKESEVLCMDNGWRYNYDDPSLINDYVSLSTHWRDVGTPSSIHYYATGFCFWQDLVKEYGYPNFVRIMQQLYIKGRGIDDYYVLDVMEEVIGGYLSEEILNRYSLTREATFVEICKGCEIFR